MKNVQENFQIPSCNVKHETIALIRHPSLLFSLYPEVKNHRSYSAPSLLFFCSQNVLHRSYSARFSISFIWHSGVRYLRYIILEKVKLYSQAKGLSCRAFVGYPAIFFGTCDW